VTRRAVLCLTLLASLALPGLAHANAYRDVLAAYQHDGSVPACQFSSRKLSAAIKEEDTYDAQYFADFTNSIEVALEAQASGQCSAGGSHGLLAPSPTRGAGGSASAGGAGANQRLGSLTAASGSGLPAPIVLMGLIALVAGLVGAGAGLARWGGWDPAWVTTWRHGVGEAGYRLNAIRADIADWRRSGRRRPSV
jgi:hypothetical protein